MSAAASRIGKHLCRFRSTRHELAVWRLPTAFPLRDGAALRRRRGKSALIPFVTVFTRPVPTSSSTQNTLKESNARVSRLDAQRRERTFLTG